MLDVLITVHDPKIILDFERHKKYKRLPKYRYAFVGAANCDEVRHLPNVIVMRELTHNIEHYKNLVDFTAWFAYSRNKLATENFVSLLQYDTAISEDFYEKTLAVLMRDAHKMLGYQAWPIADANFIASNIGVPPLSDALAKVYGVDLEQLVAKHVQMTGDLSWPSSNNLAMSAQLLDEFVNWFSPMIDYLGPNVYSGHSFERAIKVFCVMNGVENIYAPECAHHYQLNSHGTQDFFVDAQAELLRVAENVLPKKKSLMKGPLSWLTRWGRPH